MFLIDSTYIFNKCHKSFLGASLLTIDGQDNTFKYGFTRELLRTRHKLCINKGLLVMGEEVFSVTSSNNIESVINFLDKINFPFICYPKDSVLDISSTLSSQVSYIVTQDKRILQLIRDNLIIIILDDSAITFYQSPKDINRKIGVNPENIPTYLTLTKNSPFRLTKLQAVRLIEVYGTLENIYENATKIASKIWEKLSLNKETIFEEYRKNKIKVNNNIKYYNIEKCTFNTNNDNTVTLFRKYGFFSLIRLLQQPSPAGLNLKIGIEESNRYKSIIDNKGLREFESIILSSELCAIDTESDDKNPHHATLFGISFSAKKGDAFFVPLLENDLKDIKLKEVRSTLDKIFQSQIQFIGHNIKYDYLLLQKNGFKIKNIYFDTMLAAYDCYGDWDFFNLSYISQKLLGKKHKSYKEIVGKDKTFLELPFKEIVKHACEDADITMRIYPILYKELKSKRLFETYFNDTIPLMRKLGDLEFKGVTLNTDNLNKIRNSLLNNALDIKGKVYENVGRSFDLDSPKELAIILKENLELKLFIGSRKITLSLLEQLAINNEILQLIVKFKRYCIQIKSIESILKCVKNNKIYPIFNQIKSPCGCLSSKNPNLFDIEGLYHLRYCFSDDIIQYFKDPKKSLNSLLKMTKDYNLQIDLNQNENEFLKTHSLASKLNSDELLLAIIIGDSDFKLSQKFMIDRLTVSTIRHDIETRYYSLFQWIEDFKRQTAKFGYAKINHKRKYFDGLASASIEKRMKAINNSIRWLIKY